MKIAKIGLPKGSGKRLKVREKSVKSQGILKWILSGNPVVVKNESGPGRFCIMPSAVCLTTNFKVIVLLSSWRLSCDTAGSKE